MTHARASRWLVGVSIWSALLASASVAYAQPSAKSTAQRVPWLRGATCYEVFVRSFADSDGDGIGDLRGLTERLDYINDGNPKSTSDLGARCIWLMPVAESPSYHGYDVSDYYRVERDYGTTADLKRLVAEAHKRGIRVLVDMVLNHISSEHPLFQQALRDTASPARAYFRWSPTRGPNNKWGGNNWHPSPVRDEFYYGFFWKGMPDLNYERPQALAEMQKVATYWLREMGVDGFRLDAVKYLVERGTQADDTPETHKVLRDFAQHVRRIKPDAYTIGEVFDSTSTLFTYYPDQLDGYFAFEVADSIVHAVRRGDARGVLAPALRMQARIPASRWSPFLRNHDQPRTMTELAGDFTKARLAAFLLFTMPGFPFLYYGEELGMTGPKPDEQIRTPMAWTRAGPHTGFSTGTPWQPLRSDSMVANVEAQHADSTSLLNWHRQLIHLRAANSALASGVLVPLTTNAAGVAAYVRQEGARAVLALVNLDSIATSSLTIASDRTSLTPGRYSLRRLVGAPMTVQLRVSAGRQLSFATSPAVIPSRSAHLYELVRLR